MKQFRAVPIAVLLLAAGACDAAPAPTLTPTPAPSAARSSYATRPVLGAWHQLVYHARLGTSILVNGAPETGHPADAALELWSWNGRAWGRADAGTQGERPRWRNFAAVAYDNDRSMLIVHGGVQTAGTMLDETWEWDGQRWTRYPATGPSGREGAKLAYDPVSQLTVLVGGATGNGVTGDTWGWNGLQWRRLAGPGPSARFPGFLEYDAARRKLVLYGGHTVDGPFALPDTWLWDGTRWTLAAAQSPPGPRVNVSAAYHPKLSRLLQFGGADNDRMYGGMWAWDGTTWTRVPGEGVPARQGVGLAYDAVRDRLVLTGGLDAPGTAARLQDVWEWDGARWTQVLA
jgi:hypothetical protein